MKTAASMNSSNELAIKIKHLKSNLSSDTETAKAISKIKAKNELEYYQALIDLSGKAKTLQSIKRISKIAPIYLSYLDNNKDSLRSERLKRLVFLSSEVATYFSKLQLTIEDINVVSNDYNAYANLSILSYDKFSDLYKSTKQRVNNLVKDKTLVPKKVLPIYNKLVQMNKIMQSLSQNTEETLIKFIYPGNILSTVLASLA
jgi:hypothetical protein